MKTSNVIIVPANICSCRIIPLPPVADKERENIVRYKLSAFYPGSVENLKIDYIRTGESAVVFFMPIDRYEELTDSKDKKKILSTYHLLKNRKDKNGLFAVPVQNRIDIHEYKNNELIQLWSVGDTAESRREFLEQGALFVGEDEWELKRIEPLFIRRRKGNFLLQSLLLFTLIIFIPQMAYYRQVRSEEEYLETLNRAVSQKTAQIEQTVSSEKEFDSLLVQYDKLIMGKPLNIQEFLSGLSFSLGPDVEIQSLVLKENRFQLNALGNNPLGKMESFQNNPLFFSVIPYQVQALEGSSLEKFSLTGMYGHE